MNLVIYHLRKDEAAEAFALIKDLEPSVPREYILKGVVFAALGQKTGSRDHLKMAQQLFQLVGAPCLQYELSSFKYKKNLQASYPSAVAAFGSRQMVRLSVVDSLGYN